ncbi:MAG: DUF2007 domain-containing protein [Anaerolineae bacterium]|jgi:hypothetical protein|nr:DUF2007 domain-containing protein [Anaerolineae bacterium]
MKREKPVYVTPGMLQAEMVVAFLQAKGIQAFASQESVGAAFGLQGTFLGKAKVYVPDEQREEALALLEAMDAGEFELPDDVDLMDYVDDDSIEAEQPFAPEDEEDQDQTQA